MIGNLVLDMSSITLILDTDHRVYATLSVSFKIAGAGFDKYGHRSIALWERAGGRGSKQTS